MRQSRRKSWQETTTAGEGTPTSGGDTAAAEGAGMPLVQAGVEEDAGAEVAEEDDAQRVFTASKNG